MVSRPLLYTRLQVGPSFFSGVRDGREDRDNALLLGENRVT